jgi:modulator of FtsH protease
VDAWHDFFVAQVGASAALAGLIFVGVSISLDEIVGYPHLVLRAATALVLLVTTLIVASALLAPLPSNDEAGWVVGGVGIAASLVVGALGAASARRAPAAYRSLSRLSAVLAQLAVIPFIIAGALLVTTGVDGLFWLLPAFVLCYVVSLADAWVLLVETHR